MKEDAIVLLETQAIMRDLPAELQHDDEILNAVIESLQKDVSTVLVRQDALEIAQIKLKAQVDKGFELVAGEFQKVRHEAEVDRVHAQYAKQSAVEAKQAAEQALIKIQEVAVTAAVASAKADGAKDIAKRPAYLGGDPVLTFLAVAIVGVLALITMSRVSVAPAVENKGSTIKCGVDVNCIYEGQPKPIRGGV